MSCADRPRTNFTNRGRKDSNPSSPHHQVFVSHYMEREIEKSKTEAKIEVLEEILEKAKRGAEHDHVMSEPTIHKLYTQFFSKLSNLKKKKK